MCYSSIKKQGFTLLELMMVVAIIGILAAIAVPSYQSYVRKTYYAEILQAVDPYKVAIAACYHTMGNFHSCNAGLNGIPANILDANNHPMIHELSVGGGKIRVVPRPAHGLHTTDVYDLTPSVLPNSNTISWCATGSAVTNGYAPASNYGGSC